MKINFKKSLRAQALAGAMALSALTPTHASASADPLVGELMLFGGNFCPRNWAEASGQLLAIAQNTTLFSLLGTTYGGDGRTTFGLPDLRGRSPIGYGNGPGLSTHRLGQKGGVETHRLTNTEMPSQSLQASVPTVSTRLPGSTAGLVTGKNSGTGSLAITSNGGNQAFSIQAPYLAMRYCIALQGIYPSRN